MLSRYKHQNLVSLLGFCQEDGENILIYEYAVHGSLDKYLRPYKTTCPFTWRQRVTICLDAARGLDYLHNHVQEDLRVIHRDIKSANVLLNQNWEAMIADLGLSKIGRTTEGDTYLITNAAGTHGYCDPKYISTGIVTKESDVYSFGVVLFEVLSGRLCFINVDSKRRFLISLVQENYVNGKYDEFVDPEFRNLMDLKSVKDFSAIAYQCLRDDRKSRPSMDVVVEKLEKVLKLLVAEELDEAHELQVLEFEEALGLRMLVRTLQQQEFVEACEVKDLEEALALQKLVETLQCQELVEALKLQVGDSLIDYEVIKIISMMPNTRLACITREEVYPYLSTGILVDEDRVRLSIDNNGKTREMISAMKCVCEDPAVITLNSSPLSRFQRVAWVHKSYYYKINFMIRTQFLSPEAMYGAYVILKTGRFWDRCHDKVWSLRYKLRNTEGDQSSFISYSTGVECNEWMMIELFQTMGVKRIADFEVTFEDFVCSNDHLYHMIVDGIMFVPLQKYEDGDITTFEVGNLPTSSEIQWDDLLPSDYKQFIKYSNKEMMKMRQEDVMYPTKEEAYSILSRGVHINIDDRANYWFWITKSNGKKNFLIHPEAFYADPYFYDLDNTLQLDLEFKPSNESRLGRVLDISSLQNGIYKDVYMKFFLNKALLSTDTSYACYLVYQIPPPPQGLVFTRPMTMKTCDYSFFTSEERFQERQVLLRAPKIPVIGSDGEMRSSTLLTNLSNMEFPTMRNDGWWEVKVCSSEYHWEQKQTESPIKILLSWIRKCLPWSLLHMPRNEADYVMVGSSTSMPSLVIDFEFPIEKVSNIIVQGLELRPI